MRRWASITACYCPGVKMEEWRNGWMEVWMDRCGDEWTDGKFIIQVKMFWRSNGSRYIICVKTDERRKRAQDGKRYEKEGMSVWLRLRFFKMKECENRIKKEESSWWWRWWFPLPWLNCHHFSSSILVKQTWGWMKRWQKRWRRRRETEDKERRNDNSSSFPPVSLLSRVLIKLMKGLCKQSRRRLVEPVLNITASQR